MTEVRKANTSREACPELPFPCGLPKNAIDRDKHTLHKVTGRSWTAHSFTENYEADTSIVPTPEPEESVAPLRNAGKKIVEFFFIVGRDVAAEIRKKLIQWLAILILGSLGLYGFMNLSSDEAERKAASDMDLINSWSKGTETKPTSIAKHPRP